MERCGLIAFAHECVRILPVAIRSPSMLGERPFPLFFLILRSDRVCPSIFTGSDDRSSVIEDRQGLEFNRPSEATTPNRSVHLVPTRIEFPNFAY